MNISVVICAYTLDRWDALSDAVASCFAQTKKPLDVVVVIDYNDQLLERAVRAFPEALVVANDMTKGLSGARNTGVVHTRGDVIAFLDDDAYAEPKWLEELTSPFRDPSVAGTGGWVLPHFEDKNAPWFPESFYWILGCSYTGLPLSGESIRNPIGASMAMRRVVFESVGGFTSGIGRIGVTPLGCEETELSIRFTTVYPESRFVLCRDAIVHHRVPNARLTWHYFWTRCWAEGLSKAAVSSLVGSTSGLATERRHVLHALPREIVANLRLFTRRPKVALTRTSLIVAGTLLAGLGLLRGHLALRQHPLTDPAGEQERFLELIRGDRDDPAWSVPTVERVVGGVALNDSAWQPLVQVQVDLDEGGDVLALDAVEGQRVWVEAVRDGQVVGLRETRASADGLSATFLRELRETFKTSRASFSDGLSESDLPSVSVVVPSIVRTPAMLVRTVSSLLALDYPKFDVVLVDNRVGEVLDPLPALPEDPRLRVVRETTRGAAAARNRGVALATGTIIAFTDDDAVVDSNWLRSLVTRFAHSPEVDAIGGLVLPNELRTQPQLWFEEFYGGFTRSFRSELMSVALLGDVDPMFPYSPARFGAGCNMAVRSVALELIGGFDETLGVGTPARGGEDVKVFMDIVFNGGTVAFEPAALVRHTHRVSDNEFMHQVYAYGVGLSALMTELIVHEPRHALEIVRRLPGAFRLVTKRRSLRSPSSAPSYPMRTYAYQLFGMVCGPVAYFRSVARERRARPSR